MSKKSFFVIYINDNDLKTIIDSIRVVADPQQKSSSHVTVKGPYKTNQVKRLQEESKAIEGKYFPVFGVGTFFHLNQNTVFWRCSNENILHDIWKTKSKKTYDDYHPHITIYDGTDRNYAQKLFKIINFFDIHFSFKINKLEIYSSNPLFNLKTFADYEFITREVGYDINKNNIDNLTPKQRLYIVSKLCKKLQLILKEKNPHNLKSLYKRHKEELLSHNI
ncbi:MAG TPA: hypothetical protein VHP32_05725 [Ignavibacteria bacterium]|nr:hypothetical protein [Ignavibacteria bacterium]